MLRLTLWLWWAARSVPDSVWFYALPSILVAVLWLVFTVLFPVPE